jgi:hypothetical protein
MSDIASKILFNPVSVFSFYYDMSGDDLFYDGRSVDEVKEEYDTDLVDMFYEINQRRPDSWYKSYRVKSFISNLQSIGIDCQDELRDHLIDHKNDSNRGLDLADEVLADILEYFFNFEESDSDD